MTLTDTHAHVYVAEFASDRREMLLRAQEAGIGKIYMPNIDSQSIDAMMETQSGNPGICFPMMGLHPCSVKKDFEKELYVVESWLRKQRFAAVGEMGTDLYWDKTFWDQQKEAFTIQAKWAKEFQLPLVIHCRESMDETIALLAPLSGGGLTGIFHCFTGTAAQARKVLEMGFYLGIGGVATFKNSGLDKVLPGLPLDSMVLETDSPYLAPVPHRGKRNEPSYLQVVAKRLADIMGVTMGQLVETTSRNADKVFLRGEAVQIPANS